jgi:rubrerythrin
MDFVKAKEILETIKKLDHDSTESILHALNIAQHIEEASKGFYEKEVEMTKGSELNAFFAFLVKEESMHLAKILELQKLLQKKGGPIGYQIKFAINKPAGVHAIPAGMQEMTAVLYALWREKKAAEFYAEAAEKTTNSVSRFFMELADFERGHVALLEAIAENSQNTDELIMG